MSTFIDYLREMAAKGEAVNTLFEERLYELTGVLHRISRALTGCGIPHELIGGLAVLDRIVAAASSSGFQFRHTADVVSEKVRPDQATPNPEIDPVGRIVQGRTGDGCAGRRWCG